MELNKYCAIGVKDIKSIQFSMTNTINMLERKVLYFLSINSIMNSIGQGQKSSIVPPKER